MDLFNRAVASIALASLLLISAPISYGRENYFTAQTCFHEPYTYKSHPTECQFATGIQVEYNPSTEMRCAKQDVFHVNGYHGCKEWTAASVPLKERVTQCDPGTMCNSHCSTGPWTTVMDGSGTPIYAWQAKSITCISTQCQQVTNPGGP